MKFNIIMNPPYLKNTHLKFFNRGVENESVNKIVGIHPSGPFFNRRPTRKTVEMVKFEENISKNKTSLELVDGTSLFSAGLLVPLSITCIEKGKSSQTVSVSGMVEGEFDVNHLNYHGKWAIPLLDNMPEDHLLNHTSDVGKFFVSIGNIRGHGPINGYKFNPDFFTMVPEKTCVQTQPVEGWHNFGFEEFEHAQNFLDYIRSEYARVWLAMYKNNHHLDSGTLQAVPWQDFSVPFDSDKAIAEMGLDMSVVRETVMPYYTDSRVRGKYDSGVHKTDRAREYTNDVDKSRRDKTHEIFTPSLVVDMLISKFSEAEIINGHFLDPACGDGNILYHVARKKIELGVDPKVVASQIHGADIMEDNVTACGERLFAFLRHEVNLVCCDSTKTLKDFKPR